MSQNSIQVKIRKNPKFAELVGKRTRFAIILSLVVLVPYYTFMMITVFQQPASCSPAKISRRQRHHHRLADRRADRHRLAGC